MKTPYLDQYIKMLEEDAKKGINSFYQNCKLRELKKIKKQLALCNVVGRSEQLPQKHGLTKCECGEVYDVDLKANCPKCGN